MELILKLCKVPSNYEGMQKIAVNIICRSPAMITLYLKFLKKYIYVKLGIRCFLHDRGFLTLVLLCTVTLDFCDLLFEVISYFNYIGKKCNQLYLSGFPLMGKGLSVIPPLKKILANHTHPSL